MVLSIEYNDRYYTVSVDTGSDITPVSTTPGKVAIATPNDNNTSLAITQYELGTLTAGSHTFSVKSSVSNSRNLFAVALVKVGD